MKEYLGLPLEVGSWVKGEKSKRLDLATSIRESIRLLLISSYNDCRFDPTFGSDIWLNDFDTARTEKVWLDEIVNSFKEKLKSFEPRLNQITIRATIDQKDYNFDKGNSKVRVAKRFLYIQVDAKILLTNDNFSDKQAIVIGPLSFETT